MTPKVSLPPTILVRQRFKAWALCIGFLVGGGAAVWLALSDLLGTLRGLATGSPTLELSPIDARALFAGLAMLVFAVMVLLPVPEWARGGPRRRHRPKDPVAIDWAMVLMGVACACLLLCIVAPPIVTVAVGEAAARRGFRLCPSPADERRPPLRWARDGQLARCPHSWRDLRTFVR